MNPVWRSLLWKEWREHRWKMASLVAITANLALYLLITDSGDIYGGASISLALAVPLAAMFVGMGVAAGERSHGTIGFLQALPTPMARPAAAKLLWGAITIVAVVAVPIALTFLWQLLLADGDSDIQMQLAARAFGRSWGITDWSVGLIVGGVLGGLSILVWMASTGVNCSDEVRAGAVGLLVSTAAWIPLVLLPVIFPRVRYYENTWYYMLRVVAPGGPASTLASPLGPNGRTILTATTWFDYYGPFMVAALASHGALAAWYLLRFGRLQQRSSNAEAASAAVPQRTAWLAPPRRSPLAAIVWKQLLESAPLAFLGASLVILAALGAAAFPRSDAPDVIEVAAAVWLVAGAFVAIVAGVGLFMDDLRAGLHTFWRSRPISVRQWFAVKFALGAVTTIGMLSLPLAGVAMGWSESPPGSLVVGGLAAHFGLFAAGVAAMALVRQAVYAAILALAVWVVVLIAAVRVLDSLSPSENASAYAVAFVAFSMPTVLATIVAWLAVRNDWGWKG